MPMPAQRPGQSRQDYPTPWELIRAVEQRYGQITFDLAASAENAKAPNFYTEADNSLAQPWHKHKGLLWLNPPFARIELWAKKCLEESRLGAYIAMLTPASVGSNWYADYCFDNCQTLFLRPRITFVGAKDPYPKDCMLTIWGQGIYEREFELFQWRS